MAGLRRFAPVRAAVLVLGTALLAATGRGQAQSSQPAAGQAGDQSQQAQPAGTQLSPQLPTFRAGVNVVRVDVIVTNKSDGRPVDDLKPEDFEVKESGKVQ